jgi:hypothetical protein
MRSFPSGALNSVIRTSNSFTVIPCLVLSASSSSRVTDCPEPWLER